MVARPLARQSALFAAALALVLALGATTAPAQDRAEIRYLANEAVMVTQGEHKVLFDAFYSQGFGTLALVPDIVVKGFLDGTPPYDGVDALFVTHIHGDHFTAAPTLAFLRANPTVQFYGPEKTRAALAKAAGSATDPVLDRVTTFALKPGDPPQTLTLGAIEFDVIAVPHAGARFKDTRNLAFRVQLGDWPAILHLADAGADDAAFAAHQAHWDARRTHAVLPPHWFVRGEKGKKILAERIKPDQIIAIHIPANAQGKGDEWRTKLGTDAFTDLGETRVIRRAE